MHESLEITVFCAYFLSNTTPPWWPALKKKCVLWVQTFRKTLDQILCSHPLSAEHGESNSFDQGVAIIQGGRMLEFPWPDVSGMNDQYLGGNNTNAVFFWFSESQFSKLFVLVSNTRVLLRKQEHRRIVPAWQGFTTPVFLSLLWDR